MKKIGLMGKGKEIASSDGDGCKSVKWVLGSILVLFTLILAAILVKGLVLLPAGNAQPSDSMPAESSVWAAIIILAIVFLLLLYMGCSVDGSLDQGEMRRAIAGTFVLGFTMLIFFLARFEVKNDDIITSYLQMVGVIIGFYFGAKTALAGSSSEKSPVDDAMDFADEAKIDAEHATSYAEMAEAKAKSAKSKEDDGAKEARVLLDNAKTWVEKAKDAADNASKAAKKAEDSKRARDAAEKAKNLASGAEESYKNAETAYGNIGGGTEEEGQPPAT
ncbi:hypothetical protein [Methanocrinis sp.]|uniref:hypothetical protein n=1 Tax=Methanocrinis sp. TaxID=3101522 RepID=UPI003D0F4277